MAYTSSDVTNGQDADASQYNNLRADLLKILASDGSVTADVVSEKTGDTGVTIDGVLLKDNDISVVDIVASGTVQATTALKSNTVSERTSGSGVTVDGVLLKDSYIKASSGGYFNNLYEYSSGSGVTVDGLLIRDSKLATANCVVASNITDGIILNEHIGSSAAIARSKLQGVIGNAHGSGSSETNRRADWGSWLGQTYYQDITTQLSYVESVVVTTGNKDHPVEANPRVLNNASFRVLCTTANIPFTWIAVGY